MPVETCLPPEQLAKYLNGHLDAAGADTVERHLRDCTPCLNLMRSLEAKDGFFQRVGRRRGGPDDDVAGVDVDHLKRSVKALKPAAGMDTTTDMNTAGFHEAESAAPVSVDFLAPAQAPGELGRLGSYRVFEVLGHGGMGLVLRAEDMQLKRTVALKVMLPRLAADATAKERFLREARSAARLQHDHIVTIYQVGEDRGVPYLAMELLEGTSLAARLKKVNRLALPQVLRLGMQVARGLAAAHAKGLVHRDIKPANLWIEPRDGGRAKILDFGLARVADGAAAPQLTHEGAIVGTPAYMAPEQARGEEVDHRCDLFSLGCVLYQASTGELPFKGSNTLAVLRALEMDQPRPPRELNPGLPQPLSDLIVRMLAKKTADRPVSAEVVAKVLQSIEALAHARTAAPAPQPDTANTITAPPQGVAPESFWSRVGGALGTCLATIAALSWRGLCRSAAAFRSLPPRRQLYVAGASAVVLFLLLFFVIPPLFRSSPQADPDAPTAKKPAVPFGNVFDDEPVDAKGQPLRPLAAIPVGSSMGPTSLVPSPARIKGLKTWNIETHQHLGEVYALAFRSGGKHLGVRTYYWHQWDLLGRQKVAAPFEGKFQALSPDEKTCARVSGGAVELWDADAAKPHRTLRGHPGNGVVVAWSPHDDILAVGPNYLMDGIFLWNTKTGNLVRQIGKRPGYRSFRLFWSANGKTFAVVAGHGGDPGSKLILFDPNSPDPLVEKNVPGSLLTIAISPNARSVAYSTHKSNSDKPLTIMDAPTGNVVQFLTDYWPEKAVCWSWDQRILAFDHGKDDIQLYDVQVKKDLHLLKGHASAVTSLLFTARNKTLISGSLDKTVRFWDVETGKQRGALVLLKNEHWLAVNAEGHYIGSKGVEDHFVYVFQADGEARTRELSPAEFMRTYGWQNDPERVRLTGG